MEVREFLTQEFLTAWKERAGRDFPLSIREIERAFNVPAVNENVNKQINESRDRRFSERTQTVVLRSLTRQYVDILYSASESGRFINENTISRARIELKGDKCPVQPC